MHSILRFALPCALFACACGPSRGFGDADYEPSDGATDGANDAATDAGPTHDAMPPRDASTDAQPSLDNTVVYAHSDTVLYEVAPRTNTFSMVGTFAFPNDPQNHVMTDLAVDANGGVVGVTHDALYRIDPDTARCTLLAALPSAHEFVGLTYLPAGVLDPSSEVLVGGATDGSYWRIDPTSGNATMLGQFQSGWTLSGDIVSVEGAATYATVRRSTSSTDSLATIDPHTGAVHVLGDTGVARIYGLGYWRATLYGFTRTGQFLTIDSATGHAHQVAMPVTQFSGAGVTTLAPVTPG